MNSSAYFYPQQECQIPFYHNAYQQQPLLNVKAFQLAQLQQLYLQNMKQFLQNQNRTQCSTGLASPYSFSVKSNESTNSEIFDKFEPTYPIKSEAFIKAEYYKIETSCSDSVSTSTHSEKVESEISQYTQDIDETTTRYQLTKMVRFLLQNMGKNNQGLIESTRNLYLDNQPLLQAFDFIVKKYFSSRKVKEEIIRYVLRKAFKVLKQDLQKSENIKGKKASALFVKKYLPSQVDYLDQLGVNTDNEEDLVNLLMPYNSKSKNKTMNMKFVSEIFSSEVFLQDYNKFLSSLGGILEEENSKKIDSLVSALENCVTSGNYAKMTSIRMYPWLDVWINDTKNIAVALLPNRRLIYNYKKPKF